MDINVDGINNSFDDIENIIPSPINNCNKELFIEEESKLGKVEKEIDSFADISVINQDNNEIINDNSLLNINKNNINSNFPKKKIIFNLETKIKNFFENSKINDLTSSIKDKYDFKICPKNRIYESNNQIVKNNKKIINFDFQSIKKDNEKKYHLLFDKNKKLDINSLREEYSKFKNDNFLINYKQKQNFLKEKKHSSIINTNFEKKNLDSINIDFNKFKSNDRKTRYNNSFQKIDYNFKNFYTNNNSKDKYDESKFKILSNDLFNDKSSVSLFNKNINNTISKRKNSNIKKNTIFNSLRNVNKSANLKDESDSWMLSSNNKIDNNYFIKKININNNKYNNNLIIKKNFKKRQMFDKLKLNKNIPKAPNFQFITPKSNFRDFKNDINNINKNKINLMNRYNPKIKEYYYNLTNEENKSNNVSSIKKGKISFNKIMGNNDNDILEKFSNNFDAIFNFVENKIKHKSKIINFSNYKEFNFRYKNKLNFKKENIKLLSISQNEPKKIGLISLFKENNSNNYVKQKNFKLSSSKFNIKLNEEKKPFRRIINKDTHYNNFNISNFSYNDADYFALKNNKQKLLNLF